MKIFLLISEIIIGIFLILAVLLHSPKGEGMGGIGAPARVFGAQKGLESGLNKLTAILASTFFLIATILSLFF